jgi:hypothetical protein
LQLFTDSAGVEKKGVVLFTQWNGHICSGLQNRNLLHY